MKVQFAKAQQDPFVQELRAAVTDYFESRSRKANAAYAVKTISFSALFLSSYLFIIFNQTSFPVTIGAFSLLGAVAVLFLVNIAHDASHNACTHNPRWNQLLAYSWNLLGVSKYFWNLKHNLSHHSLTNVLGYDGDIEQSKLVRLSPNHVRKPFHRYQHFYALFLYSLVGLNLTYIRDFKLLGSKQFGNHNLRRHPLREIIIIVATKLFFITYMVVIPKQMLRLTWLEAIACHAVFLLTAGFLVAIVLLPAHTMDEVHFRVPNSEGIVEENYWRHQIENAVDFSPNSRFINLITGGLNTHVAHHLFPQVSAIHYFDLTQTIARLCAKHRVAYKTCTFPGLMRSHLRFLKKMGALDNPTQVTFG